MEMAMSYNNDNRQTPAKVLDNLCGLPQVCVNRVDNVGFLVGRPGVDYSTQVNRVYVNCISDKLVYVRNSHGGSIICPRFVPEQVGHRTLSGFELGNSRPLTERGKLEAAAFKEGKFYCVEQVVCTAEGSSFLPGDIYHQPAHNDNHQVVREQIIMEIPISRTRQPNGDDIVYCPELGIAVSVGQPFSNIGPFRSDSFVYTHPDTGSETLASNYAVGLIIIDSVNPGVDYYVSNLGHVSRITAQPQEYYKLCGKEDGVYVLIADPSSNGPNAIRHILSECLYNGSDIPSTQPVVLFSTANEATNLGSISYREKQRVVELDKEIKDRETEILRLKQDIELQTLTRKKLEVAMATAADERKDHYEARSYSRKDSSEGLSMTSKIVMGAIGLGMTMLGLAKTFL